MSDLSPASDKKECRSLLVTNLQSIDKFCRGFCAKWVQIETGHVECIFLFVRPEIYEMHATEVRQRHVGLMEVVTWRIVE